MTLQADGFFDWAWRLECDYKTLLRDGGKLIEARPSAMEGICGHSLEGGLSIPDGIRTLLGKGPSGCTSAERRDVMAALERAYWAWRDPLRASTAWQGTNVWGVRAMIQHAPWHSRLAHGNAFNVLGPGLEHEGRAPTPIDDNQVATSLRVTRDTEAAYGRKFLWTEHRKWGPTACPSERLAPLHAALAKGEKPGMASEEYERLVKAIFGSEERMKELEINTPLEGRVDRFERDTGPIGVRLAAIESEAKRQATKLDSHTSAPHTADGLRGEIVDAFGAAAAFLNGED